MKKLFLLTAILSFTTAHAEYDVKTNQLSSKSFVCQGPSVKFGALVTFNMTTKATDLNFQKRTELRLEISDLTSNPSLLNLWAADVLNLPISHITPHSSTPYGDDKLHDLKKIIFPTTTTNLPVENTIYTFTDGYYTSPGFVVFKNEKGVKENLQLTYDSEVKFKLLSDKTAEMSVKFTKQEAVVAPDSSEQHVIDDRETSKFDTEFTNLNCIQSDF